MINKLQINKSNIVFKDYFLVDSENHELSLKQINIFVGENNSGKSRFQRELFKSFRKKEIKNENYFNSIDFPFICTKDALAIFDDVFVSYLKTESDNSDIIKDEEYVESFKKRFYKRKSDSVIREGENESIKYIPFSEQFYNNLSFNEYAEIIKDVGFTKGRADKIVTPHNKLRDRILKKEQDRLKNISYSTYIPTMRSLKKIPPDKDLIEERLFNDYFYELEYPKLNIFTGHNLFNIIQKHYAYGGKEIKKIEDFENFLQNNFFENGIKLRHKEFTGNINDDKEIPNTNKDLNVEIENEDRPIFELGDGVLSLIILLFPLYQNRDKNHLLFIDEPELNLHPGMQRLFLETLMHKDFKNAQVFISTHSNHLLNIATESSDKISVFSFKKKVDKFEVEDISRKAELSLELLGVNNSSVFLSNCTIWVEGISERLYLRHFLNMYYEFNKKEKNGLKEFKEDFHFSFIEYSGSNLSHYSFDEDKEPEFPNINYEAISRNTLVIADKDENKEDKHKLLKERLGDSYKSLPCREIENILSPEVLRKTILMYPYEKSKDKKIKLKKFGYPEYKNKKIGNFISELIDKVEIKQSLLTAKNQKNNRNIANKREFTINALANIKEWNDLSQDAKDLTEFIYKFILKNN